MTRRALFSATAGAGLFVLIGVTAHAAHEPRTLTRLAVCGAALALLTVTDLREHRIPNRIVLPAAAICAALAGPTTLRQSLAGLAVVTILLVVALAKPAALGMGDVKEALLIALALGAASTSALLLGLMLAALAGVVVTLHRGRSALNTALPLAPFLALGATVALALA